MHSFKSLSTKPSCSTWLIAVNEMLSPLSSNMDLMRSVCLSLSLAIYIWYPSAARFFMASPSKSKFLWKSGCGDTLKSKTAFAPASVAVVPNSTCLKAFAFCKKASPDMIKSVSLTASSPASASKACLAKVQEDICATCSVMSLLSLNSTTVSLGRKSKKEVPMSSLLSKIGTNVIISSFSFDNWSTTSKVLMLSISSSQKSMR